VSSCAHCLQECEIPSLFAAVLISEVTRNAVGIGSSFPWVEQPGHEADHSLPYSVEVMNEWNLT